MQNASHSDTESSMQISEEGLVAKQGVPSTAVYKSVRVKPKLETPQKLEMPGTRNIY